MIGKRFKGLMILLVLFMLFSRLAVGTTWIADTEAEFVLGKNYVGDGKRLGSLVSRKEAMV